MSFAPGQKLSAIELNRRFAEVSGAVGAVTSVNGATGPVQVTSANANHVPSNAGGVARPLRDAIERLGLHVDDFGAVGDGVTNDRAAIQAALDACAAAGGGTVFMGAKRYRISGADLVIPANVHLEGTWRGAGERLNTDYTLQTGVLLLDGVSVDVRFGGGLYSLGVIRYGWTKPADTVRALLDNRAAFTGTAIHLRGTAALNIQNEQRLRDLCIIGFDVGINVELSERSKMDHILIDCINGVRMNNVRDVARLYGVHVWPTSNNRYSSILTSYDVASLADSGGLLQVTTSAAHPFVTGDRVNVILPSGTICRKRTTITVVSSTVFRCDDIAFNAAYSTTSGKVWPAVLYRDGVGFDVTLAERVTMTDCFAYGSKIGFRAGNTQSWLNIIGGSIDNYNAAAVDENVAFLIEGTARGVCIMGGETNSVGVGVRVNTPGALHHRVIGVEFNTFTGGTVFDVIDGRVIFSACETLTTTVANIGAGADDVVFSACRFSNCTVTNNAAAGIVRADTACDFANVLATRGEIGRVQIGAPGENTAIVLNQAGVDPSQGAQIQWGSGTLMYERVTPSGNYELLNNSYALTMRVSQAGLVTAPSLSVTTNATVTGTLGVTGTSAMTGALTIGSTTPEVGGQNVLVLLGSETGNPAGGAQIRQTNPAAPSLHVFTRVDTNGRWRVLNTSGQLMLDASQAGLVTAPSLAVSADAAVTGTTSLTGATTIGAATAGDGPLTALHVRGSPTGDTGRGGEIRQTNPTAAASMFLRVTASGVWQVVTNGYATAPLQVTQTDDVLTGTGAIATNSTAGFLHVPTMAGAPTGSATTHNSRVPIVVDTTNNRLYVQIAGVWRYATLT